MRPKRFVLLVVALLFVVVGCKNLEPTVKELRTTIKDMRTRDYEKGRVFFSDIADLNSQTLTTRIERFMDAENNAADALDEDRPFPNVKEAATKAVAKALKK